MLREGFLPAQILKLMHFVVVNGGDGNCDLVQWCLTGNGQFFFASVYESLQLE